MKILTFTSLYPSRARPRHGVFVEQRLLQLVRTGAVEAEVVAPVPWFPFSSNRFGPYVAYARTPRDERRHGLRIRHPRYLSIPKVGMSVAPSLLRAGVAGTVASIARAGFDFDLVDAHYLYPDGVAAVRIARRLGKPVVLTARGSDVNVIPRYAVPRRRIVAACRDAAAVVTVSAALKAGLERIGVSPNKIVVLRNGVDLERFRPGTGDRVRHDLHVDGKVVLSVGNLLEAKGHHLVIDALGGLPGYSLIVAGEGPMRAALEERAARHGLEERVRFLGNVAHEDMPGLYDRADVLVLASRREGMPNVVLEALACGCPVVATAVGGIPEVLTDPSAGVLIPDRTARAIAEAVRRTEREAADRAAVRRFGERFGWQDTVIRLQELFERVVGR